MRRPVILDLFCKAGGAAVGYRRAGFDVIGIDHEPQPRFPFELHRMDWREGLERFGHKVDVIHASPPCQAYSQLGRLHPDAEHPDLVHAVRSALQALGKVWVIENVPGAPLGVAALVCGLALGLAVKRHRHFESGVLLFGTTCPRGHRDEFLTVTGHSGYGVSRPRWVSVHGGGAPARPDNRRRASKDEAGRAMGIDWMTRDELSQAIPPAYTLFLGKQLLAALEEPS